VKSRNGCWENVCEEKQAHSSESGGWGRDNRKSIAPLIGRSWELSQAELSLRGLVGLLPQTATELVANLLPRSQGRSLRSLQPIF
jgi:hypothetical protein